MKNSDTKRWLEKPLKRTPKEEPEEREALEQDTKKVEGQKVKVKGPSSLCLAALDYGQGTGIAKLSQHTHFTLLTQPCQSLVLLPQRHHTGPHQYMFPSSLYPTASSTFTLPF